VPGDVRNVIAVALLSLLVGSAAWVAGGALRRDPLSMGTSLPKLTFHNRTGTYELAAGGEAPVLVVWYHSRCVHCQYEVELLNRHITSLGRVRIYMLSREDPASSDELAVAWPRLARSDRVVWGTVRSAEFARAFGTALTPAMFVFNARGRLVRKVVGETKLGPIVAMLADSAARGPSRDRAGGPAR
jgi:hypothetical protein